MAAGDAETAAAGEFSFALAPFGAREDLLDTFGQAVALHAQAVDGDGRRLEQIAAANFGGIHADGRGEFVELRFEGEADIHGAVAAHGAAGGLVGEHAIAVVANVRNVVERAE